MQDPLPIRPIAKFNASVRPPGSKSLTNRALLLAALAEGESHLTGVLFADDTRAMLKCLQDLGIQVTIDESNKSVTVVGTGGRMQADQADLFCGNAGTAYRFLTAACCLGSGEFTLDGILRMRERPIGQLVDPLRSLGADITYVGEDGFPPLKIAANGIAGGHFALKPTLSSQYISALLQIAPCTESGIEVTFEGPITSLPYVIMTLRLMERFGARFEADEDYRRIRVLPGGYQSQDYDIEPDASNASYFEAAAAIIPGSRCTIEGLDESSLQGDVRFADVLKRMGADVQWSQGSVTVTGGDRLSGIDIDLNDMPDMAQTLAVIAIYADGPTVIRNVGNLRVKETDRLEALATELTKLGVNARIDGDDLHIEPASPKPADIDTYDDHRMAMSFAIAGLRFDGVRINDPKCVNKTFPEYFEYLTRLG